MGTLAGGLQVHFTLPEQLPRLRMLLILDTRWVTSPPTWCCMGAHGIMPLYTPLSGSWLNMSESIQRIIVRRALGGQDPRSPEAIIEWLEATARHWSQHPTPFEWARGTGLCVAGVGNGRHTLGGSGACTIITPSAGAQPSLKWTRPCRRPTSIRARHYANLATHEHTPSHILITGGAGFIGSHLAEALLARGGTVTVIDDLSTGRFENIEPLIGHPRFRFAIDNTITHALVMDRLASEHVIIHLAAPSASS